jgi:SAM-dependent methyltransferase
VSDLEAELVSFYDRQAPQRSERSLDPEREKRRLAFVELMHAEDRTTVLEVGTGPGRDAKPMQQSGLDVRGIDLSPEHVRYCAEQGIDCRRASLFAIPFEDGAFAAAWTMSTLLHVPDSRIDEALVEITRVVEPGAPIAIWVWGGPDSEARQVLGGIDLPRFFSSRSDERWREILERHGTIERFETWPNREGWDGHYQYCILRAAG